MRVKVFAEIYLSIPLIDLKYFRKLLLYLGNRKNLDGYLYQNVDDIFQFVVLRAFRRDEARFDLFVYQAVVFCDLVNVPAAYQVGTTVAYVS